MARVLEDDVAFRFLLLTLTVSLIVFDHICVLSLKYSLIIFDHICLLSLKSSARGWINNFLPQMLQPDFSLEPGRVNRFEHILIHLMNS